MHEFDALEGAELEDGAVKEMACKPVKWRPTGGELKWNLRGDAALLVIEENVEVIGVQWDPELGSWIAFREYLGVNTPVPGPDPQRALDFLVYALSRRCIALGRPLGATSPHSPKGPIGIGVVGPEGDMVDVTFQTAGQAGGLSLALSHADAEELRDLLNEMLPPADTTLQAVVAYLERQAQGRDGDTPLMKHGRLTLAIAADSLRRGEHLRVPGPVAQ